MERTGDGAKPEGLRGSSFYDDPQTVEAVGRAGGGLHKAPGLFAMHHGRRIRIHGHPHGQIAGSFGDVIQVRHADVHLIADRRLVISLGKQGRARLGRRQRICAKGILQQIGNAVPVRIIRAAGNAMIGGSGGKTGSGRGGTW